MIRYSTPPSKLFLEVVGWAMDLAMEDKEFSYEEEEYGDPDDPMNPNEPFWFDEEFTGLMGGNKAIVKAIEELDAVVKSKDTYDLSDYYWVVLEGVLSYFVDKYNDGEFDLLDLTDNCYLDRINFDKLSTLYFESGSNCLGEDTFPSIGTEKSLTITDKDERLSGPFQDVEWADGNCLECGDEECENRNTEYI